MDKYAGVQNPQLYQQLLGEERKKRAREAQNKTSSTNFYNAMRGISDETRAAPALSPKESTLKAMRRAQSTNVYTNLYNQALKKGYITSKVKVPEPAKRQTNYDDAASTRKDGKQTYSIPGVTGYDDTYVSNGDGTYTRLKKPKYSKKYLEEVNAQVEEEKQKREELTEEEVTEQIMRAYNAMLNASSSNQYTFYHNILFNPESFLPPEKEDTEDTIVYLDGNFGDAAGTDFLRAMAEGVMKRSEGNGEIRFVYTGEEEEEERKNLPTQEQIEEHKRLLEETGDWYPDLGYNEDGSYQYSESDLEPANKLLIEHNKAIEAEGDRLYRRTEEQVVYWPELVREIVGAYKDKGLDNSTLDFETATNIYYGYADQGAYEQLTEDQKAAYDTWSQLADMHDYVDAYIQRYGQKKMFNKEFLEYLNQQMNGIVKYDPDVGKQVGYIVEEYWAGVVGVVETVLRLGTGAVLNAIGEGVGLLGAEEAKAGWKDAATTVLGESYTQDWRENNLKKYTMTPKEQRILGLANTVGQMVPSLMLGLATGGGTLGMISTSVLSAATTAGNNTRQALKEGATVEQALLYGVGTAVLDISVNALTGGFGGGFNTDVLASSVSKALCRNTVGRWVLKIGLTATLEQPFNLGMMAGETVLKRLIYDPDAPAYNPEQVWQAVVQGFVTRAV